ncbi:SRPBCC family protein [Dongia rigui]|uniref:SRPBCC family protein n=1 Tax=Dongia rigui TaxID=940149 RepID=A0ABU5E3B1_9PROT|nr:SRPBCC family protein [Dongia rigui]MDY0874011.1 SRPBCC family protein [Dongia rigui]
MRRYSYETVTSLPAEQLYRAFTDVAAWPQWDDGIEAIILEGPANEGSEFALVPRGRPEATLRAVKLKVETMVEPYRFIDVAYLPLARMRTEHSFIPTPRGTLVRSTVEIRGPLASFWDRTLNADYAAGAARQTRRFLAFAANWNKPVETAVAKKKPPFPFYTVC